MTDTGGQRPFEGSESIAAMITDEISNRSIQTIVETGTQYGATAAWFCQHYPLLRTITIEADRDYYQQGDLSLKDAPVRRMFGRSEVLLRELWFMHHDSVLFYLDAHGGNIGGTPVLKELDAIATAIARFGINPAIAIHDFKVPGRADLGHDTYDGAELSLEYVSGAMNDVFPDGWTVRFNDVADGACRGLAIFTCK